ncbi:MAG TPA: glycosyl transferase family 1, partial [Candidatus Eisenbacteria bacterium]|nr:glycosyl transferase family 1 [Candidatus Eisenbacteria bacterium]
RTGGLEDVVEDGVSGLLVEPSHPNALARAVERYFDDDLGPVLREGVARVRGRFTWDALVTALRELAEQCP